MKIIDRRVARTRETLHKALQSLILRRGYESITVADILAEANIGRSTFYAHFAGKEDLFRGGFDKLRDDLDRNHDARTLRATELNDEHFKFSLGLFEHAERYKSVYRALARENREAVALDHIRNILFQRVSAELPSAENIGGVPRELATRFILDTFVSTLTWWMDRGSDLAPADVNDMFRRLVCTLPQVVRTRSNSMQ
jgi:AcrR family transcriptional regulator